MLSNLFSCLDFQNSNFLGLISPSFFIPFALFFVFSSVVWECPTGMTPVIQKFKSFMFSQVSMTKTSIISGAPSVMVSLFIIMVVVNLSGLFPYVMSVSSHFVLNFCVGFTLWFTLILSSLFYNSFLFFGHFLPSGAPMVLNPFLVLVESVSIFIRPVTLTVRLGANMAVGHVVLSLVGNVVSVGQPLGGCLLTLCAVGYSLFEMAVCLIQGYIFCLLISLYADDHSLVGS